MRTDISIKNEAMEILTKHLGLVETERFVMLIQKEHFDYTQWQKNLFKGMSIKKLSQKVAEHRAKSK